MINATIIREWTDPNASGKRYGNAPRGKSQRSTDDHSAEQTPTLGGNLGKTD
jgi:hypothetical protein